MKSAHVIIGSGFGDEGKGLFTDYLASMSEPKTCVVRFNGGAQAGHTVELPDGRRHVFSHFGSGSFAGLPTFLSRFFVCNPITYFKELAQLTALGVKPSVFADRSCSITTPYDILINQIIESARGTKRHGSVGVGFGETIERQQAAKFAFCLADLDDTDNLRKKLNAVRCDYVPARLAKLGVKELTTEWQDRLHSDAMRERFIEDAKAFALQVMPVSGSHLKSWHHYIFEGAQGLLLDQQRGWFPHVTRSHTGLRNVLSLAGELGLEELDAHYLTRSYTTRHGAGPLPHELPHLPYVGIIDQTNRPHAFQGTLRFAWLSADLFRITVMRDLADNEGRFTIRPHLGMSCLDQIEGKARYIADGTLRETAAAHLPPLFAREIGAKTILFSHGPTRATIAGPESKTRIKAFARRELASL